MDKGEKRMNLTNENWIPVDEKMPCQHKFVLMTVRRMEKGYNHNPFITVGYFGYYNGWWCAHDGDCKTHEMEVLAWMPVPKAYKYEELRE